MPAARYPIEMVSGVPVVGHPGIDVINADWLGALLADAAARGHGTLVWT